MLEKKSGKNDIRVTSNTFLLQGIFCRRIFLDHTVSTEHLLMQTDLSNAQVMQVCSHLKPERFGTANIGHDGKVFSVNDAHHLSSASA